MLTRPRDGRVEQAGDPDPLGQQTFDGCLDEARRQKGQRDRHMDVALTARLTCGDGVDRRGADLETERACCVLFAYRNVMERREPPILA
jgi:hypothetical protein